MTIIVLSDLRIQPNNIFIVKIFIQLLVEYITNNNPDFVVILGNILHHRRKIFVECMNIAISMFKSIANICELYVIIGPYDIIDSRVSSSQSESWMECLKYIPNIIF